MEQVRCVIAGKDEALNEKLFWASVRLGVGRHVVIGESDAIKAIEEEFISDVEFLPAGSSPPENSIIFNGNITQQN
ncbi:MAG: hypothetical protein DSY77_08095 [Bacteroidetes bacterium]|nr:MAG: hypothetical protein DSY77_08095 [Bacteroidota bacterium]